jgi:AcrR family transcriptional regulator
VGRERRARTEARIIAAAVKVFARKRSAPPVIDEFIEAAGVAHGTFYNYFKSTDELLQAASKWLEDDLIVSIVATMRTVKDPGERVGTGVRLWLRKARTDRLWCAFVVRQQLRGALVEREVTRDLRAGLRSRTFTAPSLPVARDLVIGAAREAMVRMSAARVPSSYAAGVVRVILRGLGLKEAAIAKAVSRSLPAMQRRSRGLR